MTLCDSVAMASAQVRGVLSLGPIVVSRQESTPAFSNPAPIADPWTGGLRLVEHGHGLRAAATSLTFWTRRRVPGMRLKP